MTAAETARVRCPAKVNLFLEVLSRRPDGFHEIETVFQALSLHDTVEIARAPRGVRIEVEGADLPAGEGNLVHAAARRFLERHGVRGGVRVRLVKRIPLAAGLGGGSSDAAGTLLGLRDLLLPELGASDLAPLAAELGSDVPFFLAGGTAVGRGRGERLEALPSPPACRLLLHLPAFGLATAEVYRAVRGAGGGDLRSAAEPVEALERGGLPAVVPLLFNRLEGAAARVEPRLEEVRRALLRDLGPGEGLLLSGSGSAHFAVVPDEERAAALASRWARSLPGRVLAVTTSPAQGLERE